MDIVDRIDRLALFLGETVSCGEHSMAGDDTLEDGVTRARDELGDILAAVGGGAAVPPRLEAVLEAFATIGEVWFSGFGLASSDDLTDSDASVGEILDRYMAERASSRSQTPGGRNG